MVKKMVMAAFVVAAASGLVGTAFTSSAQATSAEAIHTKYFGSDNWEDNLIQCHAYGNAGQAAGKWSVWECKYIPGGHRMFIAQV